MTRHTRTWRAGTVAVAAGSLVATSVAAASRRAPPRRRPAATPAATTRTASCSSASASTASSSTWRRCRPSPTPTAAPAPTRHPGLPGQRRLRRRDARGRRLDRRGRARSPTPAPTPRSSSSRPVAADFTRGYVTGTGEGDVTGAVVRVDLSCSADPAGSTSGCEAADFAGFTSAADDIVAAPARRLHVRHQGHQRPGRRRRGRRHLQHGDTPGNRGGPANVTLGRSTFDHPGRRRLLRRRAVPGPGRARPRARGRLRRARVVQRHRRARRPHRRQRRHGRRRTWTPSPPAPASTTTAPARPRCSSSPSRWPSPARRTPSASPGGARRSSASSAPPQWVAQRTPEELDEIALYLNFDMIGSPNYYFGIYDANESSFVAPVAVPDGSDGHRDDVRVVLHAAR